MRADEIIVLDQGNLVERGSHLELLARKQVYYRLFSAQSSFITV
jgi:ABC-type multidrug transport system fused ATPase/permease subunit